jgi:hypothetical protein
VIKALNKQAVRRTETTLPSEAIKLPFLPATANMSSIFELSASTTFFASIGTALAKTEQFHGTSVSIVGGTTGGMIGVVICVAIILFAATLFTPSENPKGKAGNQGSICVWRWSDC